MGARTLVSASPARSGRPPRDTTAATFTRGIGGRDQCRARPGAGAEVADRQRRGVGLAGQPAGDVDQPARQQLDVEDVGAVAFLVRGEQVEQQRGEPGPVQHLGHVAVAGAVAAAAAAVGENHDPRGCSGIVRCPATVTASGGHLDFLIAQQRVGRG